MKIKYGFKKIYSNADKITVQAYGRDFMTFNKEDFGNDWQNLIDKGEIFDIGPLDVADLDKVTCTGTEIKNQSMILKLETSGLTMLTNS